MTMILLTECAICEFQMARYANMNACPGGGMVTTVEARNQKTLVKGQAFEIN